MSGAEDGEDGGASESEYSDDGSTEGSAYSDEDAQELLATFSDPGHYAYTERPRAPPPPTPSAQGAARVRDSVNPPPPPVQQQVRPSAPTPLSAREYTHSLAFFPTFCTPNLPSFPPVSRTHLSGRLPVFAGACSYPRRYPREHLIANAHRQPTCARSRVPPKLSLGPMLLLLPHVLSSCSPRTNGSTHLCSFLFL